jgi:hypothetical protein
MRDYPNMSYCMFENTMSALNQCSGAIEEALERGEPLELNQYEPRHLLRKKNLHLLCANISQQSKSSTDVNSCDSLIYP